VSNIVFLDTGPRSVILVEQAYEEEGLECPAIDERLAEVNLLFPRSFVDAVNAMSGVKTHDYCFMGSLYRPETFRHRDWILDFAKERFTDRSYLLLSEAPPEHEHLGSFDHTGESDGVFVPKEAPWGRERAYFNPAFFQMLRSSEFAPCPAGDRPWSMRFFEAVMCRSIPIVSDRRHVGRNERERSIGYHVFLPEDEHVYDPAIAEENYRLFLRHQTLIAS
jgi:Exostosin family